MDETASILASIISKTRGDDGRVGIREVGVIFAKHTGGTWEETQKFSHGPLSRYFRTNENFTFHRVSAGKHEVAVADGVEFEEVGIEGLGKKKKKKVVVVRRVIKKVIRKVKKKKGKPKKKKKVRRKKTPRKGEREKEKVESVEEGSELAAVDVKKNREKFETEGTTLAVEENKNLKKLIEGMEKQLEMKDKKIKELKEQNLKLSMDVQEGQSTIKELQKANELLKSTREVVPKEQTEEVPEDLEISKEKVAEKAKIYDGSNPTGDDTVELEEISKEKVAEKTKLYEGANESDEPIQQKTPVKVKTPEKKKTPEKPKNEAKTSDENILKDDEDYDEFYDEEEGEVEAEITYQKFYKQRGCKLITPTSVSDLVRGKKHRFQIDVGKSGIDAAVVIDEDDWHYLKKETNSQVFSGDVLIDEVCSFVDIFVKFDPESFSEEEIERSVLFNCVTSCTLGK